MTQKQKYEYLLTRIKMMRGECKSRVAYWEDAMLAARENNENSTLESAKMTTYRAVAEYIDDMLATIDEK